MAELGLAIFGAVDLCIKYGRKLKRLHSAFKNADEEVLERVVRLQNVMMRVKLQLDFLKRVADSLDENFKMIQDDNVRILMTKLSRAVAKVGTVIGSKRKKKAKPSQPLPGAMDDSDPEDDEDSEEEEISVKSVKYALLKERIDESIKDLEDWQQVFDPSWYLILKAASSRIDDELHAIQAANEPDQPVLHTASRLRDMLRPVPNKAVNIFLSPDGLDFTSTQHIPFSTAHLTRRSNSHKLLITESAVCPSFANRNMFLSDVRKLAQKLRYVDPLSFGLLECYGVVRDSPTDGSRPTSAIFISQIPAGLSAQPESLRRSLLPANRPLKAHSLSERFRLAKELATAVTFIHTFGFVHKNIRPETVLLFPSEASPLGKLFLVGLEDFRAEDGQTMRLSRSSWERDLYRHPSRQGRRPPDRYIMQHDIYSLGVCLLEIGLYTSFVEYSAEQQDAETRPLQALVQGISGYPTTQEPQSIKTFLLSLVQTELPKVMGSRYAHIVETCLTCLDPGNADFGDESEFMDNDGILVGVRYIEKVLSQLGDISV